MKFEPQPQESFPQIPQTSAEKSLRQFANSAGGSSVPKISVIVPVYKVEKYLPECIESVLTQTFADFELILVDDGSPDNCGAICDAYAARDSRVCVIHKTNGGLSSARNAGMFAARGELLMFLDGDDFWNDNRLLEKLSDAWRSRADECDFLMFNFSDYFPEGRFVRWKEYSLVECSQCADKNARVVAMCRGGVFRMSACNKIFERKFLLKNNLSFENGLISEDTPWFANLMTHSRNWRCVNVFGYAYRQAREGSITNSMSQLALLRRVEGVCRGIDELVRNARNSCWTREACDALCSFAAFTLSGLVLQWQSLDAENREKIRERAWLLRHRENPKVFVSAWMIRFFGFSLASFFMNKIRKVVKLYFRFAYAGDTI